MKNTFFICLICVVFMGFRDMEISTKEWTVQSSTVKFQIKNAGFNVNGSFKGLVASINFDKDKTYENSITATVDVKTISTGIGERDKHLKKEEYFNAEKYPKIMMKASLFTKTGEGNYKVFFKLTIKDKTRDVTVPFTFTEKDGKGTFKGSFTINRLDYGVGSSSLIMSDQANIQIELYTILK